MSNYWRVKDWKIVENKIIHCFDIDETPLKVCKVIIGTFNDGPIIRWMTYKQFRYCVDNSEVMVF